MITRYKVVYKAKHLLTQSLIHSLAHSLTHTILFVPVGTQGYNKRASLLSVCSPFGDGVPCQAASFILFFQCPSPCSFCHPLFSVRLSWAIRLVTVGTRAKPPPSSPLDLCGQGCCGCYVEQLFVGDGVGPKYS